MGDASIQGKRAERRARERLRRLIVAAGLSQRALEARLGLGRGHLSRVLAGRTALKLPLLYALLDALDEEPARFFAAVFPRRGTPRLDAAGRRRPLAQRLARLYALGLAALDELDERLARCEALLAAWRREEGEGGEG